MEAELQAEFEVLEKLINSEFQDNALKSKTFYRYMTQKGLEFKTFHLTGAYI